ncbi:MAG: hypothetical protein ACLKAK_11980 [Alkaliphilus sp.]
MKKMFTMLLVFCLVFSASFSALASSDSLTRNREKIITDQSAFPRVEIIEEEISYLEYITSLSRRLNISISEAKKIDKEHTQNAIRTLKLQHPEIMLDTVLVYDNSISLFTASHVVYKRSIKTKWFNSDFSASVAADFKTLVHGSFAKIVALQGDVYSYRSAGASNSTWEELNTWADPRGGTYPTDSVTFSATGQFEVRVSSSGSSGIDLAGFSVSHTIGTTTIYLSNPMSIRHTFSVGQ